MKKGVFVVEALGILTALCIAAFFTGKACDKAVQNEMRQERHGP